MNTFLNNMKANNNYTLTDNGAVAHRSTLNKVLDMYAFGGAYRNRSDNDCIVLFKEAFESNRTLAVRCLFYLRDIRGGQGERRFFRVCFKWLAETYPAVAIKLLNYIAEYGRWDDLIIAAEGTPVEKNAFAIIKHQLALDLECKTPSLLAKWMPSENTSSKKTRVLATKMRKYLKMTHKQYRKVLSTLRARINIVERLMSAGKWDEIEFDKIPSKAGLIYKNAFAKRDIIAKKYEAFAKSEDAKVNAKALYPHEIAHKCFANRDADYHSVDRLMLQKYWDNLEDLYQGNSENGLAIVDVSGSMYGLPLNAAVSLGAYMAEKAHGPFAGHFVTFSERPELVEFSGVDITDKFKRAEKADWMMNTNLEAVFDLLLKTAKSAGTKKEDMPTRLYILSDMQFDGHITYGAPAITRNLYWSTNGSICRGMDGVNTLVDTIAAKWRAAGYELPSIVWWNLNASNNTIPAIGKGFSYVSGFSPSILKSILSGKDGIDLMLETLNSDRYSAINL